MQPITAPLQPGDRSSAVANLQSALLLMVQRGALKLPDTEQNQLLPVFQQEQAAQTYSKATARVVQLFRLQNNLNDLNSVDQPTAAALNRVLTGLGALDGTQPPAPFVVKGTIRQTSGEVYGGAIVRAFDRDLRSEQLLGETKSDRAGYYQITYTAEQFQQAEKGSADLVVRVFDATGALQVESPTIFNAQAVEVVDLTGGGAAQLPPEYDRLLANLRPLLQEQSIANLREDATANLAAGQYQDISFLNGETGWSRDRLEHLVVAYRLQNLSKIDPAFFYALLRENALLRVDLTSMLQARFTVNLQTELQPLFYDIVLLPADTIRLAVKQAIQHNIVSAALGQRLEEILKQLAQFTEAAQSYYRNEQPRKMLNLNQWYEPRGKPRSVFRPKGRGMYPKRFNKISPMVRLMPF
jgi:hypothetical protein